MSELGTFKFENGTLTIFSETGRWQSFVGNIPEKEQEHVERTMRRIFDLGRAAKAKEVRDVIKAR